MYTKTLLFVFILISIYLMIFYYHSKKELKFIHITKCAGSFIEYLGKKNNIKWGKYHKEYKCPTLHHTAPWHHPFSILNKDLKQKYEWFVIVRNPYDRILSEYYCKWGGVNRNNNKHNNL